ncbi:DNA polymerase ligase-domain-containing protein [Gaertneriomyces semiglobifer]|nr:DNA polymerase ligase-domain-containing protein [Gaertneriomyces semiglobifer]
MMSAEPDTPRVTDETVSQLLCKPCFYVIQEHAATKHHWDLRLRVRRRAPPKVKEEGGGAEDVLRSWAVPKGPSFIPGERRLAQETTDHELSYATYEGTIPRDSYGAGTVMVWDMGTYSVPRKKVEEESTSDSNADEESVGRGEQERLERGLARGHVTIRFFGQKLRGDFTFFKMSGTLNKGSMEDSEFVTASMQGGGAWLLIKKKDEHARASGVPDILETAPLSIFSGRTMFEIGRDAGADIDEQGHWIKQEKRSIKSEGGLKVEWTMKREFPDLDEDSSQEAKRHNSNVNMHPTLVKHASTAADTVKVKMEPNTDQVFTSANGQAAFDSDATTDEMREVKRETGADTLFTATNEESGVDSDATTDEVPKLKREPDNDTLLTATNEEAGFDSDATTEPADDD